MHPNYKQEEEAIKKIVKRNVKLTQENTEIDLIIYYKNHKTRNLIMKNNPRPNQNDLKKHHVVYYFSCPVGGTCPHTYVGKTTTKLSKRLSCHSQEGAIFNHFIQQHRRRPTREEMVNNTKIIHQASDDTRLSFMEALLIREHRPTLNTTNEIMLLPSHRNRVEVGNLDLPNLPNQAHEHDYEDLNINNQTLPPNQEVPDNAPGTPERRYTLRQRPQVNYRM